MPEPHSFTVNGEPRTVRAEADTPLLYILRNDFGLKGARYGCAARLPSRAQLVLPKSREH